jgi:GNAT superfamily N-acetyltransferase
MSLIIRPALEDEAGEIARLVNASYEVERVFVLGNRTTRDDVLSHMRRGTYLVAAGTGGPPAGCVYVETGPGAGTFGMLAVDPARQRSGIGRQLIDAAERFVRGHGGTAMEIQVVNVRADLLPLYARLGYAEVGTAQYVHLHTILPVHFIVMRKAL